MGVNCLSKGTRTPITKTGANDVDGLSGVRMVWNFAGVNDTQELLFLLTRLGGPVFVRINSQMKFEESVWELS